MRFLICYLQGLQNHQLHPNNPQYPKFFTPANIPEKPSTPQTNSSPWNGKHFCDECPLLGITQVNPNEIGDTNESGSLDLSNGFGTSMLNLSFFGEQTSLSNLSGVTTPTPFQFSTQDPVQTSNNSGLNRPISDYEHTLADFNPDLYKVEISLLKNAYGINDAKAEDILKKLISINPKGSTLDSFIRSVDGLKKLGFDTVDKFVSFYEKLKDCRFVDEFLSADVLEKLYEKNITDPDMLVEKADSDSLRSDLGLSSFSLLSNLRPFSADAELTPFGKEVFDIPNTRSPFGPGLSISPLFNLFTPGSLFNGFFLNIFFDEVNKMSAQNEVNALAGQEFNILQEKMASSLPESEKVTTFVNFYERFIENAKSPILKILKEKAIEEHKAEVLAEKNREENLGFVLTSARRNYISAITGLKPEDIDPAVLRAIMEKLLYSQNPGEILD